MRTPVIAGNWKMNMTVSEATELVKKIFYGHRHPGNVEVIVAPPLTALYKVAEVLRDSYISVAAQNIYFEDKGAFTGEVSAPFIKEAGGDYVIIGHSERRQYFGETDESVNLKTKAAYRHELIPIVCVGETLEERESGRLESVIEQQVKGGLDGLTSSEAKDLIVAYEPVWAIGTGKTATPDQAEEVHRFIRGILIDLFGSDVSENIRILYGGSMKPSNAKDLISLPNIDGGLIGGAALLAEDFIGIIKSAT